MFDIFNAPSNIWEPFPKQYSLTLKVNDERSFDLFEMEIQSLYGQYEDKGHNGHLYRGVVHVNGTSAPVVMTFYQSTLLVRIQGQGYGVFATQVLPKIADKISVTSSTPVPTFPSTPISTSIRTPQVADGIPSPQIFTPIATHHTSTPASESPSSECHAELNRHLIANLLECTEMKAKYETEMKLMRAKMEQLEQMNSKLYNDVLDKEGTMQLMMARLNDIDLLEFDLESQKKLYESTVANFDAERSGLLQQIQELQHNACTEQAFATSNASTQTCYSDALLHGTSAPKRQSTVSLDPNTDNNEWTPVSRRSKTAPNVPLKPVHVSNRYSVLPDESTFVTPKSEKTTAVSSSLPSVSVNRARKPAPVSHQRSNKSPRQGRQRIAAKASDLAQKKPNVFIFGDSISKRIDSARLLRNANVVNHSESGRKIEQVADDVYEHRVQLSKADSIIVHVGTNNLKSDSVQELNNKVHELVDTLEKSIPNHCEVAISSIIQRKGNLVLQSKLSAVNEELSMICDKNKWTFIDNYSIKDFNGDNLHPNAKGMSFLARNFQDFLRCVHPHLFHRQSLPAWITHLMRT